MQVNCTNTKCEHLTVFNTCGKSEISLDCAGTCRSFKHYSMSTGYQEPYYAVVKMANGEVGRVRKFGRKLEIFGYTFFTNDNYKLCGDQSGITEARTGCYIDTIAQFKANFAAFKLVESKLPSCDTYPLCEYNKDINGYIPKEEGAGNE